MRTLRSVLVTGGAGFLGSAFVHRLLATRPGVRVVTLDALTYAGSREHLAGVDPARHVFEHGDVLDTARVRALVAAHRVDTVVHFAAESHVDRSIDGPRVFLRTNVEGTASALEGALAGWREAPPTEPPRFHHVSTDEVYGDLPPDAPPAREGDPYRPSSPYAASKAAADHLVWAWRRTYGAPVSITHASNGYGPRQYPEKLIPVVIRRALAGQPLPLYGDGRQVREWTHADDLADAVLAAVEVGAEGRDWHVGSGERLENLELVARICAALDDLVPHGAPHARLVASVPDRPGHDRRYALCSERARAELGWSPRWRFADGLVATVAWEVARATGAREA